MALQYYTNVQTDLLGRLFVGEITAEEAAEQVARNAIQCQDIEGALGRLWNILVTEASESTAQHQLLVQVLVILAQLGTVYISNNVPLIIHEMSVWGELPMLKWQLFYEWDGFGGPDESSDSPFDMQAAVRYWTNINKFVAQLASTKIPSLTFPILALHSIRLALEYPHDSPTAIESLQYSVPATVAWMQLSGPLIFSWEMIYPQSKQDGRPGRGGPLWAGEHGYCRERWSLWKSRFQELSLDDVVGSVARELAQEGFEAMAAAEQA